MTDNENFLDRPYIIIGAGGHGRVLAGLLRALGAEIDGFVDSNPGKTGTEMMGLKVLGTDDEIFGGALNDRLSDSIFVVNGVGSTGDPAVRQRIYKVMAARGFVMPPLAHPAAWVSPDAVLGPATVVMAGAIIQPCCRLGANVIVNTRASIDHDCVIGDHVHIAPGVTLSGTVRVGEGAHIGTGACVAHGLTIGAGAVIGAGAAVIGDIPEGVRAVGVPARW